ncbi:MAG: metallopeptidase family protein [Candidatus Peribacteraceae bacterium]|jgi:predicted Zn-dependent protease with MMP-like domain
MDPHTFTQIAQEAMEALPDHIRKAMGDVIIVIEDQPGKHRTFGRGGLLLGLYEGVPLTKWGRNFSGKQPDKITLFRQPIETYAKSPEEIPRVIRETVWHEVGHYFGLDHQQIGAMEKRWQERR